MSNGDAGNLPVTTENGGRMKTDSQLQRDVFEELRWDPRIREAEIGIAVKDGVVTLSGFVDSYAQRNAAERAVERISGVKAVAEELQVRVPGSLHRSDTDIAHHAVAALEWDVEVPDDKIRVRVDNGRITLEGEADWQYQRLAAERAVRYLTGVKGVTNQIRIAPRVSSYDVSQRIKDALRRSAESDAQKIEVEAKDGRVTLRGSVHSWADRAEAERAAWGAQGVIEVDDRITVGF